MTLAVSHSQKSRVVWVDIIKGMAIVLMVVGHATGLFNAGIYQFHMAAFLIVSGYTTNFEKRSFGQTLYSRFRSLLVPFFVVFLLFFGLNVILYHAHLYDLFFSDTHRYIGISKTISEFFVRSNNYTYWMGASWFIIVLFECSMIHKIIQLIAKNIWIRFCVSTVLFVAGYYLVSVKYTRTISFFYVDLALIAQFYVCIGQLLSHTNVLEGKELSKPIKWGGLLVTLLAMHFFNKVVHVSVDFPSRRFGFILTDAVAAVNGFLFLFFLAIILADVPFIQKLFSYLGRNTVPVLYFHFAAFKVAYALLIVINVMTMDQMTAFVPPPEIGTRYWWIIVPVAMAVSIASWKLIAKIKPIGILLNERKSNGKFVKWAKNKWKSPERAVKPTTSGEDAQNSKVDR